MIKNILFVTIAIMMLYSICYGEEIDNNIVIKVDVFPREVRLCDNVYWSVSYFNNTDHAIDVKGWEHASAFQYFGDMIRCFVIIDGKMWEIVRHATHIKEVFYAKLPTTRIPPQETVIGFGCGVRIPDLEDCQDSFWLDFVRNLPKEGKEITLQIVIVTTFPMYGSKKSEEKLLIFNEKLIVKPRNDKETNLIKSWYDNTPQDTFPVLHQQEIKSKFQPIWKRKLNKKHFSSLWKPEIDDKLKYILRVDDRYPGYPNLPSDWQGWKKLEESFEASTLRDEIRWTRICVQYCTTADEKVLDELKSWLEKMNPIQRAVMVNYFQKSENLPNSEKLYNTIQQFKVVKKE